MSGKAGYGKSTLLAVFARRYAQSEIARPATHLVHFIGLSKVIIIHTMHTPFFERRGCVCGSQRCLTHNRQASTDLRWMLWRLCVALAERLGRAATTVPADVAGLLKAFPDLLRQGPCPALMLHVAVKKTSHAGPGALPTHHQRPIANVWCSSWTASTA